MFYNPINQEFYHTMSYDQYRRHIEQLSEEDKLAHNLENFLADFYIEAGRFPTEQEIEDIKNYWSKQ